MELFELVCKKQNALLDNAEDYDPVREFFTGRQREIFEHALKAVDRYKDCKYVVQDKEMAETAEQISAIVNMSEPYSHISGLEELTSKLVKIYGGLLDVQRTTVLNAIKEANARIFACVKGLANEAEFKKDAERIFNGLTNEAMEERRIDRLKNMLSGVAVNEQNLMTKITSAPAVKPQQPDARVGTSSATKLKVVGFKSVCTAPSWHLASEKDIDSHLIELRNELVKQLSDGSEIDLEF